MIPDIRLLKSKKAVMFMLVLALVGYAFGANVQSKPAPSQSLRKPVGFVADPSSAVNNTFSVDLYVTDAKDVCVWQVEVVYDPYSLEVLNVAGGDFLSPKPWVVNSTEIYYSASKEPSYSDETAIRQNSVLCFATDVAHNVLLLGELRYGLKCVSGSGRVATITFGFRNHGNNNFNIYLSEPQLINSDGQTTQGSITIKS